MPHVLIDLILRAMSPVLSPILPSVFELLAHERFTRFIRSGLQRLLKIVQDLHPLSTSLRALYRYKDELILFVEGLIQWSYLHFHSALADEHYYGLKRTANHRLRSLIVSVFLPYLNVKLDSLHKQMRSNPSTTFSLVLQMLPTLQVGSTNSRSTGMTSLPSQVFIEALGWLYRLSYGFGLTNYYSPTLQLASVKLTYAKDPSPIVPVSSVASRMLSLISQVVSNGAFLLQVIHWWKSMHTADTRLSLPSTAGARHCPLCRQPCQTPAALLGSGFIYCHSCIVDYIDRYHRCPTTHEPKGHRDLIRIDALR